MVFGVAPFPPGFESSFALGIRSRKDGGLSWQSAIVAGRDTRPLIEMGRMLEEPREHIEHATYPRRAGCSDHGTRDTSRAAARRVLGRRTTPCPQREVGKRSSRSPVSRPLITALRKGTAHRAFLN